MDHLLPTMESFRWAQLLSLSPSQCPAMVPLPGKVEREIIIPRSPVILYRALETKGTQETGCEAKDVQKLGSLERSSL